MSTKNNNNQQYVVYEGEAYHLESLPERVLKYCSQENWMCDWLFASADSAQNALKIAEIVDRGRSAAMRVQRKVSDIKEKRDRLLQEDLLNPLELWELIENPEHRSSMSFNQSWFALQ